VAQLPFEPARAALGTEIAAAAKEVGLSVAFDTLPLEALRGKLPSAAAARQSPDVALVGSADSVILATRGLLVDLRDCLERVVGLNGDLFPPLRDLAAAGPFVDRSSRDKAPVWSVPFFTVGGTWLARGDLLSPKGLLAPKTFDEARTVAARLTDPTSQTFGWGASLPPGDDVDNLAQLVLRAHGATAFDADGFQVTLNPADAAPGLDALGRLYRADDGTPLAPPGVVDWSTAQVEAAFAAGKTAQMIDYGGGYARLVQANPSLRDTLLASPPPAGPKGWFTAATAYLFVAFKGSTAPERSVALIDRLLQPLRYERHVHANQAALIPPYAYLTKGPFWDDDPNYAIFVSVARGDPARSFQYANPGDLGPITPVVALARASHALSAAARSVALGEKAPAVAGAALRDRFVEAARQSFAIQPTPLPTPEPYWLHLIQQVTTAR